MDIKISSISSFKTSVLSTSLSGIQAPLFQKADSRFPSMAIMGRARIVLPPLLDTMLELTGDDADGDVSSSFIFRFEHQRFLYESLLYFLWLTEIPRHNKENYLRNIILQVFWIPSVQPKFCLHYYKWSS